MIKRLIILCIPMLTLLVACGEEAAPSPTSSAPTNTPPAIATAVPSVVPSATPADTPTKPAATDPAPTAEPPAPTAVSTSYPDPPAPTPVQPGYPEPGRSNSYPAPEESELVDYSELADADVTFVRVVAAADGSYTFYVTVEHPDLGWEDYTNGWDVMSVDGVVFKTELDDPFTRLLLHPHENEQPFTRSQSGLVVPADVTQLVVRAHDIIHGWGGQEIVVDLTQAEGDGFTVER